MNYQRKENSFHIEQDDFVFTANRSDPYGFWTIKGKKGKQNIKFEGEYTSSEDAIKAVKRRIQDLSPGTGGGGIH